MADGNSILGIVGARRVCLILENRRVVRDVALRCILRSCRASSRIMGEIIVKMTVRESGRVAREYHAGLMTWRGTIAVADAG